MGTHEVLSLQFGHYSNFIGTHWWNIQETSFEYHSNKPSEINNDVLFREGLTDKGEVTYTPRLLLVDLKGSLGSLSERGSLYEPPVDPSKAETHWNNVQTETAEPTLKNKFQEELATAKNPHDVLKKSFDLSNDVKVWSDFLYSQFHPRTVNTVSQYSHNENSNFSGFTQGLELWNTEQFTEAFSDKIRNYIEECDHFQGFHVTFDSVDGFSGLASSCIKYIEEEYEKKPILAFPVIPSCYSVDESSTTSTARCSDSLRIVNLALCYDALNEYCSLFVPLCTGTTGWRQPGPKRVFNLVSYNRSLYYHTSAILAAAMDTFTLKHRLKSSYHALNDVCTYFNSNGRKAVAASVCLPFGINESSYLIDCLDNWDGPLTKSITPSCLIGTDNLVQIFTLRGIPENRLKRPISENQTNPNIPAQKCNTVNEMLSFIYHAIISLV
ncbi:hypothetical protein FQR65_LT09028 [Abscondita terminalis]|nr:hypothetical protein FQR65_LT09028 [Abscondita terminalis]